MTVRSLKLGYNSQTKQSATVPDDFTNDQGMPIVPIPTNGSSVPFTPQQRGDAPQKRLPNGTIDAKSDNQHIWHSIASQRDYWNISPEVRPSNARHVVAEARHRNYVGKIINRIGSKERRHPQTRSLLERQIPARRLLSERRRPITCSALQPRRIRRFLGPIHRTTPACLAQANLLHLLVRLQLAHLLEQLLRRLLLVLARPHLRQPPTLSALLLRRLHLEPQVLLRPSGHRQLSRIRSDNRNSRPQARRVPLARLLERRPRNSPLVRSPLIDL